MTSSDDDTNAGASGSARKGSTPSSSSASPSRPDSRTGLGRTQGPCATGRRDDPDSWTGSDPDADRAASDRLPLLAEPIVRVRAVPGGARRSRAYRAERRRVRLYTRAVAGVEHFVVRLEEERTYFGWIPWTRSADVYSLHAKRLELVARVFLGTGHVPAERIL